MIVIAEYDSGNNAADRVNARNLEGSALDQQKNNPKMQNETRPSSGGLYHSYDKNNLAEGRTYIDNIDLDSLANNGTIVN